MKPERAAPDRRVFVGPFVVLLLPPAMLAFGVLLAVLGGTRELETIVQTLLWVFAGVLGIVGVWIAWRLRRRYVVEADGVTEFTSRGRRFFAWEDLRKIRDEMTGHGRHATRRYRVLAKGGRTLSFYEGSVRDAEGLASILEDQIRAHRSSIDPSDAVGLGNLDVKPQRPRRRKRYYGASKRERIIALVIGLIVVAITLVWTLLDG